MTTDNRNGPALFPDVDEDYGVEGAPDGVVEQQVPVVDDPTEPFGGEPEPAAEPVDGEPPSDFEHRPTWLAEPQPEPAAEPAPPASSRRPLVVVAAAVSLLAVAGAATVVVLAGGDRETTGAAVPVSGASATSARDAAADNGTPVATAAWCADAVSEGRSVGRGPGTVDNGPGVIRAFDHAYYAERDGARVASLMVTPNPVPEIQKWIDDVPVGTEHCVTIASTPDPNTFEVDLGLRMPDGTDGIIRQRVTVAASPDGFKIAKVEDLR